MGFTGAPLSDLKLAGRAGGGAESSQIGLAGAIARARVRLPAASVHAGEERPSPRRNKKRRLSPAFWSTRLGWRLALPSLETRIGFADHEDLATAADDLAVAMAGLRRLEGRKDFHGNSWQRFDKEAKL